VTLGLTRLATNSVSSGMRILRLSELRLLDQQRDRLSAAEAQGRDAALGLTFRHRIEQRDGRWHRPKGIEPPLEPPMRTTVGGRARRSTPVH
jgi:hypothetical protein